MKPKKVIWNGKTYLSGNELQKLLKVSSSAVTNSIKQGTKLKGHYIDYAL